jgi:RecB family endonuclease NucS
VEFEPTVQPCPSFEEYSWWSSLLAKEKKTGQYIVVELKKVAAQTRCTGKCSRYMGWVRKYLADGDAVHGVIAARKVDEKLMAARDAHDTKVHLIEFEMKVSAKAV